MIQLAFMLCAQLAPQASDVELFGRSLELEPVVVEEGDWVLGGDWEFDWRPWPFGEGVEARAASVRLVDGDGRPLAGVAVDAGFRLIEVARGEPTGELPHSTGSGVTGSDGVVELAGLGTLLEARFGAGATTGPFANGVAAVGLTAKGASLALHVFEQGVGGAKGAPIEVVVRDARWLDVRFEPVLDHRGLPFEGVELELESFSSFCLGPNIIGRYPVDPGADSLRIGPLPVRGAGLGFMFRQRTAVRLKHPDAVGALREAVLPALEGLEPGSGGVFELELSSERELWADRELRLRLLDKNGTPRGAMDCLATQWWESSTLSFEQHKVRSDAASILRLPIPSNSKQDFSLIACGDCFDLTSTVEVEWDAEQLSPHEPIDVVLDCACWIDSSSAELDARSSTFFEGRVRDQLGTPVVGASVTIKPPGADRVRETVSTDAEGRFVSTYNWGDAPRELMVRVEHPDVVPQGSTRLPLPLEELGPVDFDVVRGERLRLELELDAWVRKDDLWIELRPLGPDGRALRLPPSMPFVGGFAGDLRVSFQAVPAGSYSLHVAAGEGGDALFEQRVEVDGNRHLGRLDLRGSLEVGVLMGLPEHSPSLELTLVARTGAGQVFEVRSGSASSFERERLLVPAGVVELGLVSADGAPSTFSFSQELPRAWFALPRAGHDLPVYSLANR